MDEFILKEIKNTDLRLELSNIGFDKSYVHKAIEKYQYKNLKIFALTLPQTNILKQTAISVGADCAIHREVITAKIDKSDCILGGSFSQLRKIAQKLRSQPFKLAKLADLIEQNIDFKLQPITIKETVFDFKKPYIVGVLNLTKNSFSDGGDYFEFDNACSRLAELVEDGADIIELGAESTKPFSTSVGADEQLEKLLPVLNFIKEKNIMIPVSIDTRSAKVAQKCIEAGADIINDVSGLEYDDKMAEVIAKFDVPVIIQHTKGEPETMQIAPSYENLMDELFLDLKNRIDFAVSKGIKFEKIIVDAGIGFGKSKEHNFEIINRAEELLSLGTPLMLGVSRKGLLNMQDESNEMKDIFTLALNSVLINKKINFIRVHNVKLHRTLIDLITG